MAETLIVGDIVDENQPRLVLQPPAGLSAEQMRFWAVFPTHVTPKGALRRKIGLTRNEWYNPHVGNLRYHKVIELSEELSTTRVKQLLEDDAAFLAYVATLRLQGA